jgi:hypothetical protein
MMWHHPIVVFYDISAPEEARTSLMIFQPHRIVDVFSAIRIKERNLEHELDPKTTTINLHLRHLSLFSDLSQ